MLVNPYTPGSKEFGQWEAQKAIKAARRVDENPRANVSEVQDIRFGRSGQVLQKMQSAYGQTQLFGKPLSQMKYMAEGGEIEDEDAMPVGEMSLLAPMEEYPEGEESPEEFTSLIDVLGEQKFAELEQAMSEYPVVAEVAEMAILTSDGAGAVSGPGDEKSDSIPARLSDGEFVFSAEAVKVIGMDELERMHEEAKAIAAAS
jgi:hypothetical protein